MRQERSSKQSRCSYGAVQMATGLAETGPRTRIKLACLNWQDGGDRVRKRVGKLGERAFALICEQADLTAHPPDEDRFGWDFLVEEPRDLSRHTGPIDAAPAPLEFRVQVKATNGTDDAVEISLAHMHRLAGLQMPVFFCCVAFDGGQQPVRVHLVHLGEELIGRTLARVRELETAGDTQLHQHTLTVRCAAADALTEPFHGSLRKKVAQHVPDGMTPYLARKNKVLDTAGYTDPRFTIQMTTEPLNADDMVDFYLDLKKEIKLTSTLAQEHRFGIARDFHPRYEGSAILSITDHQPRNDAVISIRKHAFSRAIAFPAKLYAPPRALDLPDDHFKVRLLSPCVDMLLWPIAGTLKFSTIVGPDEERPLEQLADFAEGMHWLSEPGAPPCRLDITLGERSVFGGSLRINNAGDDWGELAAVAAAALGLARRAGAVGRIHTTLDELTRRSSALRGINGLADGAPAKVEFPDPAVYFPNARSGFIKVFCITLSAVRLAGVMAMVGQSVPHRDGYAIETRDVRFFRVFAMPASEAWNETVKTDLIQIASDALAAEDIIPIAA